jgi:transposase
VGTACNNRGHAVLADRGIGEERILWTGHITNQGSPWVRGILQEAAQTAKRHPMFAGAYAQLAHRRGNNIATTAIARRLLARCFHILIQLEPAPEKAGTGRARVSA